jgi:glycosyltransferase involved in cell wall biosynthesis
VVLEAMASGLPCVIADSGGSRDFIEDGVNGFKCNPYDASGFLNRITEIIVRPELARQFSAKGLENSKRYIWEHLASEYFEDLKCLSFHLLVV